MKELADKVREVVNPDATTVYKENTADDPGRRKPDITKAKELLGWERWCPWRRASRRWLGTSVGGSGRTRTRTVRRRRRRRSERVRVIDECVMSGYR